MMELISQKSSPINGYNTIFVFYNKAKYHKGDTLAETAHELNVLRFHAHRLGYWWAISAMIDPSPNLNIINILDIIPSNIITEYLDDRERTGFILI